MPRIGRSLLVAALSIAAMGIGLAPADPEGSARETGYIQIPDGPLLAYTAVYPNDGRRHPTLFEYSGYNPGSVPDEPYIARYVSKGYAYIGVNIRGTGCSGGTFDFFAPIQADDGAYVIDNFIPMRPWSNGDVAMIGKSYPGITQLFVAARQPKHLKAIAPGHFYADAYRDVAYPGGILDYSFAALWSFISQPVPGYGSALQATGAGDAICARNMATHTATNARYNPFVQAQEHRFDDAIYAERSPQTYVKNINVPVFTALAWQDEQLGSRQTHMLSQLDVPYWVILTNGDHGMYRTATSLAVLDRFFDHYLKGIDNGFENTPRVLVWWEANEASRAPRWVTGFPSWPVPSTPQRLFLAPEGALAETVPTEGMPDPYLYPAGSQGIGNPRYGYPDLPDLWLWPAKPLPGTAVAYTTPPLAKTTVALGSASLDLWLASTAADTDVQVTLTEVRPDGQEMYVQKGWLRASHRALDAKRSTSLVPYQTHKADDFAPLIPGEATAMRVEIFPFGHVFRAGSRIRVWIEAPTLLPELWGFAFTPIPAVNLIYHDADHPSSLVLPIADVPVPAAATALAECGTVVRQPCRAT